MPVAGNEVTTPDGPMPLVEARPSGEPGGAVVVVQEAFGLTTHIEEVCLKLADAGWVAVAPALFHRQGSPVLAYDDMDSVMKVMGHLDHRGITADVEATLQYLDDLGHERTRCGMVGFCMGGTVTFAAAASFEIGAAVTYYGGGVESGRFGYPPLVQLAPTLRAPWLGQYGDLDRGIPVSQVEELRSAVSRAAVDTEVVLYEGANHGFNCNDRPSVFEPSVAATAWSRTLEWFDRHLAE